MSFITSIIVAILSGYLAFTNTLANYVLAVLPTSAPIESVDETTSIPSLPSHFSGLTSILRDNAEYQRAAALEGVPGPSRELTDFRHAVVNIVCTFTTDDYIRTTTGTGFFVHQSGVLMTNAHVAQFLLLAETETLGDASCVVKSGEPNTPTYEADLLYLPPSWISANADRFTQEVPMGTGERDYALLYVTNTTNQSPLPAAFPALRFDTALLPIDTRNKEVIAIGYPASNFKDRTSLPIVMATTSVSELFTFGSNYADVFGIRGTAVGAGGSSGGPIITPDGTVIGMITTRGNDAVDGPGSLRAISISHIHRTIEEETGFSLERNVDGDIPYRATVFKQTLAPFLISLLTKELSN